MSENKSYEPICIVSMGGVFPGALSVDEFWNKLLREERSFSSVNDLFWLLKNPEKINKLLNSKKSDPLYVRTNKAFQFSKDEIEILRRRNNLDEKAEPREVLLIDLLKQNKYLELINQKKNRKHGIFLGYCGTGINVASQSKEDALIQFKSDVASLNSKNLEGLVSDAASSLTSLRQKIESLISESVSEKKSLISYTIKETVNSYFNNTDSEFVLIDSACASTLAAIDMAINKLRSKQLDIVMAGGIFDYVELITILVFSKMEAVCVKDQFLPFDKSSTGFMMGLGGALFAFKRLEDAINDKDDILAVIAGNGYSSDGGRTSLFEPSLEGQILAYERAYSNLDSNYVDYLETHGTGTPIGDIVETESIKKFFTQEYINIGTVKSLLGHTIAAAGAASILKSLLIIKNKQIPSQNLVKNFVDKSDKLKINFNKNISLNKDFIRVGVSSFGFGGTNFHLVLNTFRKKDHKVVFFNKKVLKKNEVVVVGRSYLKQDLSYLTNIEKLLKIPPTSVNQVDEVQAFAVLALTQLINESKIKLDLLDRDKVSVISTSSCLLNTLIDNVKNIHMELLLMDLFDNARSINELINKTCVKIDQDFGVGHLNNVIAGRTCNVFNFRGKNFNLDVENNSFYAALSFAHASLESSDGLFIIISNDEVIDFINKKKKYLGIKIEMLATKKFALENFIPIVENIDRVEFIS